MVVESSSNDDMLNIDVVMKEEGKSLMSWFTWIMFVLQSILVGKLYEHMVARRFTFFHFILEGVTTLDGNGCILFQEDIY